MITIFGEKKGTAPIAAARMQRCKVLLSAYHQYHCSSEFKPTKTYVNADGLSCLPVPYNAAVGNPQDMIVFNP